MRVTSHFVVVALSLCLVFCAPLPIDQSPTPFRLEPQFSIPTSIPDTLLYLEFIVGPDGRPEAGTLRFVDARNDPVQYPQAPAFLDSVWAAVRQWEYTPAQFQGGPIRALVRQPVIHRRTPKPDTVSVQSLPNKGLLQTGPSQPLFSLAWRAHR
jgi:hypothetical protein